jgi:hypothetical protein
LGYHGIHEALVHESRVDALPGHEVDEVLETAFELPVVVLPHIIKYLISFIFREDNLDLIKDLLESFQVEELSWHVLQGLIDHLLESRVLLLQSILDLFIEVIQLLP